MLFLGRYETILHYLEGALSGGNEAVQYIKAIDAKMYAKHTFPFPRMGKINSNPLEQANSRLLGIREFSPLKLVVEFWFYL